MNLNKIFFCLLFVTLSLEAGAQKKYVILEFETKMPVRDAQVQVDSSSSVVMTNYLGECVLPDKFKKISIFSPLHEPLTLNFSQVRDTIILLPNVNRLNEVVINGDRPPLKLNFNRMKDNIHLNQVQSQGFNPIALIGSLVKVFFKPHKKKDMKKFILETY